MRLGQFPVLAEVQSDGMASGGGIQPASPEHKESPPIKTEISAEIPSTLSPLDWRESLAPEFRTDPTVQKYTSLQEYVKGTLEAGKLLGRSIQIPPVDAPADAWNNVYEKLGRPKSLAEYTDPAELELPDGWTLDAETTRALRETAFAEGYTQKQYEAAIKVHAQWLREMTNQVQASQAEAYHVGENTLAKQFGASAPRLKQAAQATFAMLGNGIWGGDAGVRAWQKIQDAGLDNDIDIVTAFANQYEKMREGQYLVSDTYTAGVASPAESAAEMKTLMDKKFAQGHLSQDEQTRLDSLYEGKSRLRESGRGMRR